jgi:hypothetical protein
VILGSIRKEKDQLPKNCLCVISNLGKISGYYDKQRLYKSESEFYSAGDSPFVVNIKGHKKIILYANPGTEGFYKKLGFKRMNTAMAIFQDQTHALEVGLVNET